LRKWHEDSIKCLGIIFFSINFVKENENLGKGMSLCNLIGASKSPFPWGNWRKMGFCNQLLQIFLSNATSVLVACDKISHLGQNSHIGQVEKTHFFLV
jgi:hypothetical protein